MTQYGYWTQHAQILCPDCVEHVGHGMKQLMKYGIGTATCDHCHKSIKVEESLAEEQMLVYKARQTGYPDSYMDQTGGMCHNARISFIDFAGKQWCCYCSFYINPDDPGETTWFTEILDQDFDLVSERSASSIEEILSNIYWMQRNCSAIPSAK